MGRLRSGGLGLVVPGGSEEWWDALSAEDFVSGVLAREGVAGLRRYALVGGKGKHRRQRGRQSGRGGAWV